MSKRKLLIIDDNLRYAQELGAHFMDAGGFELLPYAPDAQRALASFGERKPDVVVLDMIMPRMDGLEILSALHARGALENVSVFATSPFYLDTDIFNRAAEMGVRYIFYKPVDAGYVCLRILELLELRDGMRESAQERARRVDAKIDELCSNYLRLIGVGVHLKGYDYTKNAVHYCICRGGRVPSISKELFPYIATLHHTTWKCVDRDIRTAIEYAWSHGDMEAQHRLFGNTVKSHSGAPTCKEFIATLCERILPRIKQL